jgi:hypothetical protein
MVKWRQTRAEEYYRVIFTILCMLFNEVESRMSSKRWGVEFVTKSISDGCITLHVDFYPGSGGRFEDFQKDLKGAIRPDTEARDGGNDTEVQESEREVEIQDSEDEWN